MRRPPILRGASNRPVAEWAGRDEGGEVLVGADERREGGADGGEEEEEAGSTTGSRHSGGALNLRCVSWATQCFLAWKRMASAHSTP